MLKLDYHEVYFFVLYVTRDHAHTYVLHLETKQDTSRTEQNKTRQNKTKQNKTRQNKTKQNKTKQNKTKQLHKNIKK
jgi:hypothetical protein